MEVEDRDWILVRCGNCRTVLRLRRGLPVAYLDCPTCEKTLAMPDGILDPGARFSIFDAAVAIDTPKLQSNGKADTEPVAGALSKQSLEQDFNVSHTAFKKEKPLDFDTEKLVSPTPAAKEPGKEADYHARRHRSRSRDALVHWDLSASSARPMKPDRLARKFIRFAVFVILVMVGTLVFLIFKDRENIEVPQAPKETTEIATSILSDGHLSAFEYDEVRAVAKRFLEAPDLEALMAEVRNPEKVRPLAKSYYARKPYKPFGARSLGSRDKADISEDFLVIPIMGDNFEVLALGIECTTEGPKIDWESFVAYSEMELTDLIVKQPVKPILIRVMITPDTYFNYGFSDATKYLNYQISDRDENVKLYAYAELGTEVAERMKMVVNKNRMLVTLRVHYPEPALSTNQVIIEKFVSESWMPKVSSEDGHHAPILKDAGKFEKLIQEN